MKNIVPNTIDAKHVYNEIIILKYIKEIQKVVKGINNYFVIIDKVLLSAPVGFEDLYLVFNKSS